MSSVAGIYCIENTLSGKKYFGSSANIFKRLAQHKTDLIKQTHHNILLQRAVNKYGIEVFKFYVVKELLFVSKQLLFNEEQKFIDQNVNGYNLAPAGGGDIISSHPNRIDIIKKMSESLVKHYALMSAEERKLKYGRNGRVNGNWRNGGQSFKPCPKCASAVISKTAKSCAKCRNRLGNNNSFYGKHHSDKTKALIREKVSGDNSWIKNIDPALLPYTKRYKIKDPLGRETIVAGLKTIAEQFNVSITAVHQVIKRIKENKLPKKGKFANYIITEDIS